MPVLSDEEFAKKYGGATTATALSDEDFERQYGAGGATPEPTLAEQYQKSDSMGERVKLLGGGMKDAAMDQGGRFLKSAGRALNPMPFLKGLVTEPAETITGLAESVSPAPSPRRIAGAYEQMKGGRPLDAALSMGPPITEGVVNQARSGDVAGAAGTVAGLVAGPKILKGAGRVLGAAAPALERGAQGAAVRAANATLKGEPIAVRAGINAPGANSRGVVNLRGQSPTAPQSVPSILGEGAAKVGGGLALKAMGAPYVGELGAGAGAYQTLGKLIKTPQFQRLSASTMSRVAELVKKGDSAGALAEAFRAMQLGSQGQN